MVGLENFLPDDRIDNPTVTSKKFDAVVGSRVMAG